MQLTETSPAPAGGSQYPAKEIIMKQFNDSTEMAKEYAAENNITLLSAIGFIRDVSASYFEAKTGIKANKPVVFVIWNFGYVSSL